MTRLKNIKKSEKNPTLLEISKKFLMVKQAQHIGEQTMQDYKIQILRFLNETEHGYQPIDYATLNQDVLDYFGAIPDTSPARYNKPYQYLSAFFTWMAEEGIIPKNPIKANKLKKRKDEGDIQPVAMDSIKRFLKAMDTGTYTGLRDYCIACLMLDTGIRTKEALNLHNSDYDRENREITVTKQNAKTKSSRILFLKPQMCLMLDKLLEIKPDDWHDWLFPTYEGNNLVTGHLDKSFAKYSLASGVKITPYQLRHTYATEVWRNNGDLFSLQKTMGHADLRMTKRYTEVDNAKIKKDHDAFSPLDLLKTKRKR